MANLYNDTVDIGTDWYLNVTWENESGTPYNLTGYTFEFVVADNYDATTPSAITLTLGSGITVSAPATGVIECHISNTQSLVSVGTYVYDLYATSPSVIKTRLLQGQLLFSPKVP